MELTPQRAFLSPDPADDWKKIAARVLPDEEPEAAIEKLRSWNMHLFARNPPIIGTNTMKRKDAKPSQP